MKITTLGTLCITLARLWCADRDGPQGVFLQSIAQLLARKTTQRTARARAITDRRELCRGFLDLAKNVFPIHGINELGKSVIKKQLKRNQMAEFFVNLPPCLIGMEACGGTHHWARQLPPKPSAGYTATFSG